jgi:hypothetical protein
MEIQFNVDPAKLEEIVFKAISDHIIKNEVPVVIDRHDKQLKEIIIGACTHAVRDLFQKQGFQEWIKEAIKIEIEKVKNSITHTNEEYKKAINVAIKEEVKKRVHSIVNKPGFDHYIMGCVQLEVKDKILTIV